MGERRTETTGETGTFFAKCRVSSYAHGCLPPCMVGLGFLFKDRSSFRTRTVLCDTPTYQDPFQATPRHTSLPPARPLPYSAHAHGAHEQSEVHLQLHELGAPDCAPPELATRSPLLNLVANRGHAVCCWLIQPQVCSTPLEKLDRPPATFVLHLQLTSNG